MDITAKSCPPAQTVNIFRNAKIWELITMLAPKKLIAFESVLIKILRVLDCRRSQHSPFEEINLDFLKNDAELTYILSPLMVKMILWKRLRCWDEVEKGTQRWGWSDNHRLDGRGSMNWVVDGHRRSPVTSMGSKRYHNPVGTKSNWPLMLSSTHIQFQNSKGYIHLLLLLYKVLQHSGINNMSHSFICMYWLLSPYPPWSCSSLLLIITV